MTEIKLCRSRLFLVAIFYAFLPSAFSAVPLAATPPMGWNSWNQFGCNISEKLIRDTADALISSGLKSAGYSTLIVDDCWQANKRDTQGRLYPDPVRFPPHLNGQSVMKDLVTYVHSKGLKFGLYTSVGEKTCGGRPATHDNERLDAETFASWGVDYIKLDECIDPIVWWPWNWRPWTHFRDHCKTMSGEVAHTGRPMTIEISNWGLDRVWEWAPSVGQLWRTGFDIKPNWTSVMGILDNQIGREHYAGPGHWNDPDMLEVGVEPLSETESRAHFSLWAILAAPLIAGNDLRNMPENVHQILTASEVIAIDQDSDGNQGKLVSDQKGLQIWARKLAARSQVAVVLLNRRETSEEVTANWAEIGLKPGPAAVRDLWEKRDLGVSVDHYSKLVPPHGAVMIKVSQ